MMFSAVYWDRRGGMLWCSSAKFRGSKASQADFALGTCLQGRLGHPGALHRGVGLGHCRVLSLLLWEHGHVRLPPWLH